MGISPLSAVIACALLTGVRQLVRSPKLDVVSRTLGRVSALALVLFCLVQPFLVQIYFVPSRSMAPTLLPGDFVFGLKRPSKFARGEVVVFRRSGESESGTDFVKRVVGLPGEVVEIRGGRVFVDGKALDEPYVLEPWTGDVKFVRYAGDARPEWRGRVIPVHTNAGTANWNTDVDPEFAIALQADGNSLPLDRLSEEDQHLMLELATSPPAPIPGGQFLVLGDNRHGSRDGRNWGLISQRDIAAKVVGVAFPLGRMGGLKRNSPPP